MIAAMLLAAVVSQAGSGSDAPSAPSPSVLTNPDWTSKPTGDDYARYYPDRAQRMSMGGRATLACKVSGEGRLVGCEVVQEDPKDFGFGEAALRIAPLFKMRLSTKDGQTVMGSTVRIPISFVIPGPHAPYVPDSDPMWIRRPSQEQIDTYYPKEAARQGYGARVVLHCDLRDDGTLTQCTADVEGPFAAEFRKAALAMTSFYQMAPQAVAARAKDGGKLNHPVIFTYYSNTMKSVRAVQPGAKEGTARVNCRVTRDASLENCLPAGSDEGRDDLYDAAFKVAARIAVPPDLLEAGTRVILPVHVVPPAQRP